MICDRCGHRFNLDYGRAGIFFAHGKTNAEQLSHGRTLHLCPDCADVLKTWLGIPPRQAETVFSGNAPPPDPPAPGAVVQRMNLLHPLGCNRRHFFHDWIWVSENYKVCRRCPRMWSRFKA